MRAIDAAAQAGKPLYAKKLPVLPRQRLGKGTGKTWPSLGGWDTRIQSRPGEIFWFITRGSKANGMPLVGFLASKPTLEESSHM